MSAPTPIFRAARCSHGLMLGLCEVWDCPGYAKTFGSKGTAPKKIKPPRCSNCKMARADAVPRGPSRSSGGPGAKEYPLRYCKDCWDDKIARGANAERVSPQYRRAK